MGNIVTNLIQVSGENGPIDAGSLEEVLAGLSGLPKDVALAQLSTAEPDYGASFPISPKILCPQPDVFNADGLAQPGMTDLTLALASETYDLVAHVAECDPAEMLMPPGLARTRRSVLAAYGFGHLDAENALEEAELRYPGIKGDRSVLVQRIDEAGFVDVVEWREKVWGTRAFGEAALVSMTAEGALRVRFVTVNTAPSGFVAAIAARFPNLMLQAAGYDEDTDYAFSAVSSGVPGEIEYMEEDCPEAVRAAKAFIFPGRPEPEDELAV